MAVDPHGLLDDLKAMGEVEQRILHHLVHQKPVTRNAYKAFTEGQTFGERVADRVAAFGGSWSFIGLFFLVMGLWMALNVAGRAHFDPYPFILLNLVLSCLAALQAPVIMMSQNRQAAKDRSEAQHDYEINLKAELEIVALHLKVDELRKRQWEELLEIQRRQIGILEALEKRLDTPN